MTEEERSEAARGWREAGLTPKDLREKSPAYELGWTRGSLLKLLGQLRNESPDAARIINRIADWEASLPPVDGSY